MQVTITFRHLDNSDAVKSYVEEKLGKLTRFFSKEPIRLHAILSHEKFRYGAEVTVNAENLSFACVEESSDLYVSIDRVYHKLEEQLRRHKERIKDHKALRSNAIASLEALPEQEGAFE